MRVAFRDIAERVYTLADGHTALKISHQDQDINVTIDCKLKFEHHIVPKNK